MRYHNITKCDMLNGEGLRVVLWCSHCEHNCPNCQNPQTHSENSGITFDNSAKKEIFEELNKEHVKGITLSGGDPLSKLNRDEMCALAKEIKIFYPCKDIWCYTGYEWDEVKDLEIMKYIDVLVTGRFVESLSVPSPRWCGSSNQKILDVQKSLELGEIVER